MTLENSIADVNSFYFLREFTYSHTTFESTPRTEVELADNIVWLNQQILLVQVKERNAPSETTTQAEERWFEKKVMKAATRQVRDSLSYLSASSQPQVVNCRGDMQVMPRLLDMQVHKLVVYCAHDALPRHCRLVKHHGSRSAGFIHIMSAEDYVNLVKTLATPAEIFDYLAFRECIVTQYPEETRRVPEISLAGQFCADEHGACPDHSYSEVITLLDQDYESWDMSGLLHVFRERLTAPSDVLQYHRILCELANLRRSELKEFKKRFELAREDARKGNITPFRMAVPRTGCGFVFVPMPSRWRAQMNTALQNFTYAHKYELKLSRCVGVAVSPLEGQWYDAAWCLIDEPWQFDKEMEEALRVNNPFLPVSTAPLPRYQFRNF
jgi:hypothetical protein